MSRPQIFSDIYVQLVIANLFSPHMFALHDNNLKKTLQVVFLIFLNLLTTGIVQAWLNLVKFKT